MSAATHTHWTHCRCRHMCHAQCLSLSYVRRTTFHYRAKQCTMCSPTSRRLLRCTHAFWVTRVVPRHGRVCDLYEGYISCRGISHGQQTKRGGLAKEGPAATLRMCLLRPHKTKTCCSVRGHVRTWHIANEAACLLCVCVD